MDEVEKLIQQLKDPDPEVRADAADIMREFKMQRAVPYLIEALDDEDSLVRDIAAEALGEIGGDKAVSALIAALRDDNADRRLFVGDALEEIGLDKLSLGEKLYFLIRRDYTDEIVEFSVDYTLPDIMSALKGFIEKRKHNWDEKELDRVTKQFSELYVQIAKTVSERRKKEMGELKLPFKKLKETGKKMYRARRAFA